MAHNVTLGFQQDKSPGWEERLRSLVDELESEVSRLTAELANERKRQEPFRVGIGRGELAYGMEDGQGALFLGRSRQQQITDELLSRVYRPELDRMHATFQYLAEQTGRMLAAEKRRPDSDGVIGTVK